MKITRRQISKLIREAIHDEIEKEETHYGIPPDHASHIELMWRGEDAYGNFDPNLRRQAWSLIQSMEYNPKELKIWGGQLWGGEVTISRSIPPLTYSEIERVVRLFNEAYLTIGGRKELFIDGVNQNEVEATVYLSDGAAPPIGTRARKIRILIENKIRQVLKERNPNTKSFQAIFESARKNVSQNEIQKIENLWWSDPSGMFEYPHRPVAHQLIKALDIDPRIFRIWEFLYPWGESYQPWRFYGGEGEWGFTAIDIERIIEYYNTAQEDEDLKLSIHELYLTDAEAYAITTSPPGIYLDVESGDYDARPIKKLIAKAWFETSQ